MSVQGASKTGGAGVLNLKALGAHLQEHPGTQALRGLKDELVDSGVPLDKLNPTPGLGSHDAWVKASSPDD